MPEPLSLEELIEDLSPKYPAWLYKWDANGQKVLRPPKTPGKERMASWAEQDHLLHSVLLERFRSDLTFYRQSETEVFASFNEAEDNAFYSTEPTVQVNKLCNMLSGIPPRISFPWRDKRGEEEAQAMEDWGRHLIAKWSEMHRSADNGELQWELLFSAAIYGRMVARVLPDPDDYSFPWKIDLLDPSTVFITPGDKWGPLRAVQVYHETLEHALDNFGEDGRHKLRSKFIKHYNVNDRDLDEDKMVEVKQVWTRWSHHVSVDGICVIHRDHEFGRVPFIQRLLPGEMGGASTPEGRREMVPLDRVIEQSVGGYSSKQMDMARKGLSFCHAIRNAIRYEEMLFSLLMTMVELDVDPPQVTTTPYEDKPGPVGLRPGDHTTRRPGESTSPVTPAIRSQAIGPVATLVRQMQDKGGLPATLFGIGSGSNVSGFAESTLIAAAKDRIGPYVKALEDFFSDVIELAAYLFHGFGWLYTESVDGTYATPKRRSDPFAPNAEMGPMPEVGMAMMQGQSPDQIAEQVRLMAAQNQGPAAGWDEPQTATVDITRDMMANVGFRPVVTMEGFDWNQLTQQANAAGLMIDKEIWSTWTARDKLGVENPTQEHRWIRAEQAMKDPKLVEQVLLPRALWDYGDVEGFLQYKMAQMQAQQPAPGAMGPGGPPPGGPPGPPPGPVPGIQSVQGDSQPMMSPDGVPGRPRNPQGPI